MGSALKERPRIFGVNWFRVDENGKFMWPGFGENMRVLKWVVERCNGEAGAAETPLGYMPRYDDMEWRGLDGFTRERFDALVVVDRDLWRKELEDQARLFATLSARLPAALIAQREALARAL
jgi:phosphoenolpyruvate carboxykinase (GTP)